MLGKSTSSECVFRERYSARIEIAIASFDKKPTVLTGELKHELKKQLVKTLVWSVGMYGLEKWS